MPTLQPPRHLPGDVDLLSLDYFGTEITLATFQILERLSCVVVPSSLFRASSESSRSPNSPLWALGGLRLVH